MTSRLIVRLVMLKIKVKNWIRLNFRFNLDDVIIEMFCHFFQFKELPYPTNNSSKNHLLLLHI
jgi:hypothetical protein